MDTELENAITMLLGVAIKKIRPVSGGDISQAFLLETASDRHFCKVHRGNNAIKMFMAEKQGLEAIAKSGMVKTPAIFYCEDLQGTAVLILQYIEGKQATAHEMHAFGESLARLHNLQHNYYGWETPNFIGSLPQSNKQGDSWALFFINERLKPQFKMAADKGLIRAKEVPSHDTLHAVLERIFEPTVPSLLHGDLWNGNFLVSQAGEAYLIDPAVYYGHSEVDLAMSRLFGGFGKAFYNGYESLRPAPPGSAEREKIYQLYYLLVHLNLFGSSYHSPVMAIVSRFFGV